MLLSGCYSLKLPCWGNGSEFSYVHLLDLAIKFNRLIIYDKLAHAGDQNINLVASVPLAPPFFFFSCKHPNALVTKQVFTERCMLMFKKCVDVTLSQHGGDGLMIRHDIRGLFQPQCFHDSVSTFLGNQQLLAGDRVERCWSSSSARSLLSLAEVSGHPYVAFSQLLRLASTSSNPFNAAACKVVGVEFHTSQGNWEEDLPGY